MALRNRIALTFLGLLAAALAASFAAVWVANHASAEREVNRQLEVGALMFSRLLESNRRQLTQAALCWVKAGLLEGSWLGIVGNPGGIWWL